MSSKFVCSDCVDDYAINAFITGEAQGHRCSYCSKAVAETSPPIAAEFDSVADFVRRSIEEHYRDPAEILGYDSVGGEYVGDTMNVTELFEEVGLSGSNADFLEDLERKFDDHDWVKKDPHGESEDDVLRNSWEQFSEQVKHETRFVFFKVARSTSPYPAPEPFEILGDIGKLVIYLKLFQDLPVETLIIRARQHGDVSPPTMAADLGAPPKELASQSRMSPAGIPMFYGAADELTAFKEIFSKDATRGKITFGRFKTLRPLLLLDLTSIPSVPSFFEPYDRHVVSALSFMQSFEESATEPIPHDESQHYQYVPTQIITEYFRHVFLHPSGKRLDGIVFNSSKSKGTCYTLFADSNQCTNSSADTGKSLYLESIRCVTIDFNREVFY